MKLIDGIRQSGQPFNIPDSSRNDLPQFFVDSGYKTGAEIGVYQGEYTELLCKVGLKVIGIDPWIVYRDYRKHPKELPYEELFDITKKRLAPYDCTLIRKTSMDALDDISDESLDFVYIDGNHALPYITQDIYSWNKKVRSGGVISGHDYFNSSHNPYWIRVCHVKDSVNLCAKILGVENFYILKNKDKCPSWFWVKK